MNTLNEFLWDLNVDDLKGHLRILESSSKVTRKADLVAAITEELSGKKLLKVYESLSDLDKKAVIEAVHSADLQFNPELLEAKYGSAPKLYREGRKYYYRNEELRTLKTFFYQARYNDEGYRIPLEMVNTLRQFIPAPKALEVKTAPEPKDEKELVILETEYEALQNIPALLRLAEQGKVKISEKTGKVSKAMSEKLLTELQTQDYYPDYIAFPEGNYESEVGNIKTVGWLRMLEVAGLFKMNGTKSKLSPSGLKYLKGDTADLIKFTWNKWLDNNKYDEFNRVEEIKGQNKKGHMTAKPPRRHAIIDALSDCPTGEWVNISTFSKYMRGAGFEFQVSLNEDNLYICDANYGNLGYNDYGGWDRIETRYILALLFEYAASLGLIDIAYVPPSGALDDFKDQWGAEELSWLSRYDGLRAFRLTHLGAYCLNLTQEYLPPKSTNTVALTISTRLLIEITSGTLEVPQKLLLDTWAQQKTDTTWQIDPIKAVKAVEQGQEIEELVAFLEGNENEPLSARTLGYFKHFQADGKALQASKEMQLFRCRDEETCALIATHKNTAKYCKKCGDTEIVVFSDKVTAFRKAVNALGLGVVSS